MIYRIAGRDVRLWLVLNYPGRERGDVVASSDDRPDEVVGKWSIPEHAIPLCGKWHTWFVRLLEKERGKQ